MAIVTFVLLVSAMPEPPASTLPWGGRDFVQYYVAWELIRDGKNPYDQHLAGARQTKYGRDTLVETFAPPWALLPSLPLVCLPFHQAVIGYIALNVALFIFISICWNSLFFRERWRYLPLMLVSVFLWLPSLEVLGFGQNSLWPLAGFTGWIWCITRRRWVSAGLFLVLTVIKPHIGLLPAIFAGVYCLRHRHWSTILAFSLGLFFTTGVMIWFRPTIWTDYLTALQSGTSPTLFYTATLDGWLRAHFSQTFGYLSWALWVIASTLTAIIAWRGMNRSEDALCTNDDSDEQSSLFKWSIVICMATVVFVPYAFPFDYVLMLPGYFLAMGFWLENKPRGRVALTVWVLLFIGLMLAHSARWTHDNYWVVPWTGLGITAWLLRNQSLPPATPA